MLLWFLYFGLAVRLLRRPIHTPGHFLVLFGLVAASALVLQRRLVRMEWFLWGALALFLFGAEVREAVLLRAAERTFLICRIDAQGNALIQRIGTGKLRDVTMRIIDHTDLQRLHREHIDDIEDFRAVVQTVQLGNFLTETSKTLTVTPLHAHGGTIRYHISFEADTGYWWETITLQKRGDQWLEALRVWRYRVSAPSLLYQSTDPGMADAWSGTDPQWSADTF